MTEAANAAGVFDSVRGKDVTRAVRGDGYHAGSSIGVMRPCLADYAVLLMTPGIMIGSVGSMKHRLRGETD